MKKAFLLAAASAILASAVPLHAAEDPFLWLEEREGKESLDWVRKQNRATARLVTADSRFKGFVETFYDKYSNYTGIPYVHKQGEFLYTQDSSGWYRIGYDAFMSGGDDWQRLIDFGQLSKAEKKTWSFYGADCLAPEFERCLISMSPDGGDAVEIREFNLKTRRFVRNGFFSPVSRSSMTWRDDDSVLVMDAYEPESQTTSGYPRIVRLLERGQPLDQAEELFAGERTDMAVYGSTFGDGYVFVRNVDFYNNVQVVDDGKGKRETVPLPSDLAISQFYEDQFLFSPRSEWTAPDGTVMKTGGLYSFAFDAWAASGEFGKLQTLMAPNSRVAIEDLRYTKDRLFVTVLDNVKNRIIALDLKDDGTWVSQDLGLPKGGSLSISDADPESSTISFVYEDFLAPASLIWSEDSGRTLNTFASSTEFFDAEPFVSEQFEATSKDGTKVPYFVVHRKDQTEPVPTLLYGYGGFAMPMKPAYLWHRGNVWLEEGNAYVVANIRGGGEFGPEWHIAAVKENRQRAYDDMAAVAEDLVKRGITSSDKLAVQGGSNGGLLAGVMLTQRPELFGAVLSEVPLLDMLRYTYLPVGASWIAEYGDPDIPEQAAYIAKYSPYQNVSRDKKYPLALFTTNTSDDRVHPGHARKMAALMQSLGFSTTYFTEGKLGGHGGSGTFDEWAKKEVTRTIFLQRALEGETKHPVAAEARDEIQFDAASILPVPKEAEEAVTPDCRQLDAMSRLTQRGIDLRQNGMQVRKLQLEKYCAQAGVAVNAEP